VTGNAVVAIPRGEQILVQRVIGNAAVSYRTEIQLRSEGPDTDAKDNDDNVPLGMYGHTETAMVLIDRGGQISPKFGNTALTGHVGMVTLIAMALIEGDIDAKNVLATALHLVSHGSH
jgi:hypothetical protein